MKAYRFNKSLAFFFCWVLIWASLAPLPKVLAGPDSPEYIKTIGSAGIADGQFNKPFGIAFDSTGILYVADSGNHRIQKFDPTGNFIGKWGKNGGDGTSGLGDGEFKNPYGIAIDSNDHIYVVDGANHRIQKFDKNGNFLAKWGKNGGDGTAGTGDGEFTAPQGIAVDSNNHIYVAERSNHRIQEFDENGNFLGKWGKNGGDGSSGPGNGEFSSPSDISMDANGNIYVSEGGRIQKFNGNMEFVAAWGTAGTGDGEFTSPYGVSVDSDNHVYVADTSNDRIQKFDENGTFLMKWGSEGSANDQFNLPVKVAFHLSYLYVSDYSNHRIQVFGVPFSMDGVGVDVANGSITGTTTLMEVSVDSTNGADGTWTAAGSGNTPVAFAANMNIYVRESANPSNNRLVATIAPPAEAPPVTANLSGGQAAVKLTGATTEMEYSRDGGSTWNPVTAAIASGTDALDVSAAPNQDLRVRVAATASTLASQATGSLNAVPNVPVITQQPEDATADSSGAASFSVTAIGAAPLTYQWQMSFGALAGFFIDFPGATNAELLLSSLSASNSNVHYRVKVTDGNGQSVLSNEVVLTVNGTSANQLNNTVSANPAAVATGDPIELTATGDRQSAAGAAAGDERFVPSGWSSTEPSQSGAFEKNDGEYTATYTPSAAGSYTVTATFQMQRWNGAEWVNKIGSLMTKTVNVTVSDSGADVPPTIISQPDSVTKRTGDDVSFTVVATGTGELKYQWQADDGTGFTDIADATNATLELSDLTAELDGNRYRVIVTDGNGLSANSNAATLTVKAIGELKLDAVGGNRQVALDWNSVSGSVYYELFMATATGQYGENPLATVTEDTYTVHDLTNGKAYYFTVKAKDRTDFVIAESNEVSVTPKSVPASPTQITAVAGSGQATVSFQAPSDDGGSPITGYKVTASPGNMTVTGGDSPLTVTGLANGTSYTFTVEAINAVGNSVPSAPSNAVTPGPSDDGNHDNGDDSGDDGAGGSPSGGNGNVSGGSVTPVNPGTGADVLVNGKVESAGTVETSEENGRTITTVIVDEAKLEERLAAEGDGVVVTIPVTTSADTVIGELTGRMVKHMEDRSAVLEIQTGQGTYTLPAEQINIDAISERLGQSVALEDIKVQIEVAKPAADRVQVVENAAEEGGFTLVVPPLDFTVRAIYGDTAVEVTKFDAYVERTIAIPEGVDPDRITTGVVIEPDGTAHHVPTKVEVRDGNYSAVINSLTNSTYVVVWHPIEFDDAAHHWSKAAVNDMGSRMIVDGGGDDLFNPDQDITRAEFAAIIVRGLGLRLEEETTSFFSDVEATAWHSGAIHSAYAYGLISGFEDGTFRPNDKITREQAMVIIAKAMKITELQGKHPTRSAEEELRPYADGAEVSEWARSGAADSLQAGIVMGRSHTELAPKAYMTRAEVAMMVQRLLQESGLI